MQANQFYSPKTLILQLIIATFAGWICNWLHISGDWLLGPLVIGIFYALVQTQPQPLPKILVTLGQVIIALGTADSFSFSTFELATRYPLPFLKFLTNPDILKKRQLNVCRSRWPNSIAN